MKLEDGWVYVVVCCFFSFAVVSFLLEVEVVFGYFSLVYWCSWVVDYDVVDFPGTGSFGSCSSLGGNIAGEHEEYFLCWTL